MKEWAWFVLASFLYRLHPRHLIRRVKIVLLCPMLRKVEAEGVKKTRRLSRKIKDELREKERKGNQLRSSRGWSGKEGGSLKRSGDSCR